MALGENVEERWTAKLRLEKISTRSHSVEKARLFTTPMFSGHQAGAGHSFSGSPTSEDEREFIPERVLLEV